jgi:hypothetical protein
MRTACPETQVPKDNLSKSGGAAKDWARRNPNDCQVAREKIVAFYKSIPRKLWTILDSIVVETSARLALCR